MLTVHTNIETAPLCHLQVTDTHHVLNKKTPVERM